VSIEEAFTRVVGRPPSDEQRARLDRLRDAWACATTTLSGAS
jgi:hypothetical protein